MCWCHRDIPSFVLTEIPADNTVLGGQPVGISTGIPIDESKNWGGLTTRYGYKPEIEEYAKANGLRLEPAYFSFGNRECLPILESEFGEDNVCGALMAHPNHKIWFLWKLVYHPEELENWLETGKE